ncbi:FolC bifunctional protein [Myriangium duriaei CBS 260.36]|uniref:FolC bifunctional protein n=1 Tax=Myriangium duriaei CBS 260.36 TaxID=1168546 RepID=A0A9P4J7A8_9PEZI|nr:FolC bifunctional protein [Myriangium duriaei CBS 260.36]
MIELGLTRIHRLLSATPFPWRAIHVAGTNGKGSVCATITALLEVYNRSPLPDHTGHPPLRHGRFTSPHLVDRWDSITLNGATVHESTFHDVEARVKARNSCQAIGASEFELLTATAFEVFTDAGVDVAVVEVGMGGGQDATNVIGQLPPDHDEGVDADTFRPPPLATGITSIGLDHVDFLGPDLPSIAAEKAGIIKRRAPVVAAHQATSEVEDVIRDAARRAGVRDIVFVDTTTGLEDIWKQNAEGPGGSNGGAAPVQTRWPNGAVALQLTWKALKGLGRLDGVPADMRAEMMRGFRDEIGRVVWHGRLEKVNIRPIVGHDFEIILDGAHNADSARILRRYLDDAPDHRKATTWVLATSSAHKVKELLPILLMPGDTVRAVEFGPVDGMPWIKPAKGEDIVRESAELTKDDHSHRACGRNHRKTLSEVCADATKHDRRVVVTGSLYLIGEIYGLIRKPAGKADGK